MICYSPLAASWAECPVYLGGSITELDQDMRLRAVKGFIFAGDRGIREIERWKKEYLDWIRDHVEAVRGLALKDRKILLFLIREKLLDEEGIRSFLKRYMHSDDTEIKASLLQDLRDRFGDQGPGDFTL